MSRPRIRTLKPELWQDEKVGGLSRDARLLFIGLVTMADDEGRLRALPALILGHVFPYDQDALRKLEQWLAEIAATGLIERYAVDGTPYVQIVGWVKHQRINRPNTSELPSPSTHAQITESSVSDHGAVTALSRPAHSLARGGAQADRIGSGEDPPLTPPPPAGGRKRSRDAWTGEAVTWAHRAGVTGATQTVVKALGQAAPWTANGDAPGVFRAFCRQHFPSLTVNEEKAA